MKNAFPAAVFALLAGCSPNLAELRPNFQGMEYHHAYPQPDPGRAIQWTSLELDDLTHYLSTITVAQLPNWSSPVLAPLSVARGEALAEASCIRCHTPSGSVSSATGMPSLNGQYQDNFIHAMGDYRHGIRQEHRLHGWFPV